MLRRHFPSGLATRNASHDTSSGPSVPPFLARGSTLPLATYEIVAFYVTASIQDLVAGHRSTCEMRFIKLYNEESTFCQSFAGRKPSGIGFTGGILPSVEGFRKERLASHSLLPYSYEVPTSLPDPRRRLFLPLR